MFDADHEFPNLIGKQFDRLEREITEVEAELISLQNVGEENFKKILSSNNFEKYKKIVTGMSVTSFNTRGTFDEMDAICVTALEKAPTYYKKPIKEIQKKIAEAREQSLSYAGRLPFSFGEGWKAGGHGLGRHAINIIGHLLVLPAVKGHDKGKTFYNAYLSDLEELTNLHEEIMQGRAQNANISETRSDMRESFKSLKVLIRTSRQVFRSYRKTKKECLKICKEKKLDMVAFSLSDVGRHFGDYSRWNKELKKAA